MSIHRGKLAILFLSLIVFALFQSPAHVYAETQVIIAEGTYNMGDGETPSVAEERALLAAKRAAMEQAGTYLESYTRFINAQLTEDEIRVLASGSMEVNVLEKRRTLNPDGGLNVWVKIHAKVTSDTIDELVKRIKANDVVEDYSKLKSQYAKLQEQYNALKSSLSDPAALVDRQAVTVKMIDNERAWLVNRWFEAGSDYMLNGKYREAAEAFTKSFTLNKKNAEAAKKIGDAYFQLRNYAAAIDWYNKAVEIEPKYEQAYWRLGNAYEMKKDWFGANLHGYGRIVSSISRYDKPVNPNNVHAWFRQGLMHLRLAEESPYQAVRRNYQYHQALNSFNKTLELSPHYADAQYFKGFILDQQKEVWEAIVCYKSFLALARENHPLIKGAKQRLAKLQTEFGIKP